jgi:Zn-dependent alcohol dehydrogenases
MKAALFDEPRGPDSLKVKEIEDYKVGDHEVLVKVDYCGVNPVDNSVVSGIYKASPIPHIPGGEVVGIVEKAGAHSGFKGGERVINYQRVFCGDCNYCLSSREMLCKRGGIVGVATQGCYAEYMLLPASSAFIVPYNIPDELAVSLPVGALTAYHALKRARISNEDRVLVFGASGNTGLFLVQLAKLMGAKHVTAVTRKDWVRDYGADELISVNKLREKVREPEYKFDVVIDPLGSQLFDISLESLDSGGRVIVFGVLTGEESKLNLGSLYRREFEVIGSTGGIGGN